MAQVQYGAPGIRTNYDVYGYDENGDAITDPNDPRLGDNPSVIDTTFGVSTDFGAVLPDPTQYGYTPLYPSGEIPTYEEWLTPERESYYQQYPTGLSSGSNQTYFDQQAAAQAAGIPLTMDNPAEYDYLSQYYQAPDPSNDWAVNLPIYAAAAFGGAAASGAFAPYTASGTGALEGAAATGAVEGAAAVPPPESYWSMGAENTVGGVATDASAAGAGTYGAAEGTAPYLGVEAPVGTPLASPTTSTSLIPGVSDQLLGGVALGGFGYLGAQQQTKAFEDMAAAERARLAPYDQKLQESYSPDFNLWEQPGYEGALEKNAEIVTRQVTAQMGNPANNPAAEQEIQRRMDELYFQQLNAYRSGLTQSAGLSTGAVPAQVGAIQSTGQGYNALGYSAAYATNPYGGAGVVGAPGAPVVYIGGVPYRRAG